MKIYLYVISIIAIIMLAGCSANDDNIDIADEEQVYSFTAVLGDPETRVSYQEDETTKNLKLHWDDGDVIRLYPDASMGDDKEYYEFVAHTSQRSRRCAFIYQGVIPNWEHWSGKAVYVFPDGENLTVEDDSKEFEVKILTQKTNNSTEHLKYAEHVLSEDGSKQYSEFWKQYVKDFNLKDNYELYFTHPHTIVYALKLRGFIYDIPGGSMLKVSGASWVDGDTITLNLGTKDDKEPFLKVGEFGCQEYDENAVLTAYIIRQVAGETDGSIKKGEELKIELLSYDKDDGRVYPLHIDDDRPHRTSVVDQEGNIVYFTNQPWGDEYTWKVTASANIDYNVGDYVVADLTDTSMDVAYPRIAIDLGLPKKWAAYNIGAKKINDYGKLYVWGYTFQFNLSGENNPSFYIDEPIHNWESGDATYDAATAAWDEEWGTPTDKDLLDLVYYCPLVDGEDKAKVLENIWDEDPGDEIDRWQGSPDCFFKTENQVVLGRLKSTFNGRYFYVPLSGLELKGQSHSTVGLHGYFYATGKWYISGTGGPLAFILEFDEDPEWCYLGYSNILYAWEKAVGRRAVKLKTTN